MTNTMIRDVFLSFVRVHILHHAAKGRIFGLEMIDELRRHGYALSPGTLYPILHGLEQSGLLKCEQEVVGGKMRKYYTATQGSEDAGRGSQKDSGAGRRVAGGLTSDRM